MKKLPFFWSLVTQIAWHLMPWTIEDLFSITFSDGSTAPSSLALWSSPTADALPFYRLVIFSCICVVFVFFVCCNYVVCCIFCCVVFVSVAIVLLCYCTCRVMGHNVCYFCCPLCLGLRLCCNHGGFPSILVEWKVSVC